MTAILFALLTLASVLAPHTARAHESRPAFLELRQLTADTYDVLWKVPAMGDRRLGIYVRMPDGTALVEEPRGRFTGSAWIERWRIRHPGALVGAPIYIEGLSATLTDVLVRVERLDGTTQVARLMPDRPTMTVEAFPSRLRIARTYAGMGLRHIMGGIDHLLFVLGLLFFVRGHWMLVKTITSFTIAHSITLAIATLGLASANPGAIETLIALSILFLGLEIMRCARGDKSLTIRYPWIVAFAFGLLHGFGFASGLAELGLPQREIPLALLMFNVGVEIGQLGFVVALLIGATLLKAIRFPTAWRWERVGGYAVGTFGAYWAIERAVALFIA